MTRHERRIGVYICHCGGNISDYVDVAAVREALQDDPDVVVAETTLFACSDGTQHEMIDDIRARRSTAWSSRPARPSCTRSPSAACPSGPT